AVESNERFQVAQFVEKTERTAVQFNTGIHPVELTASFNTMFEPASLCVPGDGLGRMKTPQIFKAIAVIVSGPPLRMNFEWPDTFGQIGVVAASPLYRSFKKFSADDLTIGDPDRQISP